MITMSKSMNDNVYTSVLVYQFINIREILHDFRNTVPAPNGAATIARIKVPAQGTDLSIRSDWTTSHAVSGRGNGIRA
jgi:hypothetical protein